MYRTMTVDDDFLVRSYLKQLDAWEKAGYEITADVRMGKRPYMQSGSSSRRDRNRYLHAADGWDRTDTQGTGNGTFCIYHRTELS